MPLNKETKPNQTKPIQPIDRTLSGATTEWTGEPRQ